MPKPANGRQGLAGGSWGQRLQLKRVHFGVFSTSRFAPPGLISDWIFSQADPTDPLEEDFLLPTGVPTDLLLGSEDFSLPTGVPK